MLGLQSPILVEVERVFTRFESTIVTNPWDSSVGPSPAQECKSQNLALRVSFGVFSAPDGLGSVYNLGLFSDDSR